MRAYDVMVTQEVSKGSFPSDRIPLFFQSGRNAGYLNPVKRGSLPDVSPNVHVLAGQVLAPNAYKAIMSLERSIGPDFGGRTLRVTQIR